jgi:hypothetical protein
MGATPPLREHDAIALALRAAREPMHRQDKVWSRFSDDKIDIAHQLATVIRSLARSRPADAPLSALSIGSSNEPQFRILESFFRAGLYLVDIERSALDVVRERIDRQRTDHVHLVQGDYRSLLGTQTEARAFRAQHLGARPVHLVTLHHSLYYCPAPEWPALFDAITDELMSHERPAGDGPASALHAVLMASTSDDPETTTWLYNHFAGRFFGARNDQDLQAFARDLVRRTHPDHARIQVRTVRSRVSFYTDDFAAYMSVIWMILLHPNVHAFTEPQQEEVAVHAYRAWSQRRPLVQEQDHLVLQVHPHDA